MSSESSGTVVIAGWYPDPSDDLKARWWDGTQWSESTRARDSAPTVPPPAFTPTQTFAPAPAPTPIQAASGSTSALPEPNRYVSPVAVRTEVELPPVDPYRPLKYRHDSQGFVSMGVKTKMHFQPTRAYTGSVWAIATVPIWSTIVLVALQIGLNDLFTSFLVSMTSFVLYVICFAFAIHDHKVMLSSLHPKAASHWWMILGPLAFLIARGVYVSRNVGHGWAPLIIFLISSLVPVAAILAFSALASFFASLLS